MAIHCDSKVVSLADTGKLLLLSNWTSDRQVGELARVEVRLPLKGKIRFVVEGAHTTVVEATKRQVEAGKGVKISTGYMNLIGGPKKRLARLVFCCITSDGNGGETEVKSKIAKFLP